MDRPLFVAIEGTDGSGKTTIRKHLYQQLRLRQIDALSITGYSWMSPEHTKVIVQARFHDICYSADSILNAYVGDKERLSRDIIIPHLQHRTVICDRYVHSDLVQQMLHWSMPAKRGHDRYLASCVQRPDVVLFIDTPPEIAITRISNRPTARLHPWEQSEPLRRAYDSFQQILYTTRDKPFAPLVRISNTGDLGSTLDTVTRVVLDRLTMTDNAGSRDDCPRDNV